MLLILGAVRLRWCSLVGIAMRLASLAGQILASGFARVAREGANPRSNTLSQRLVSKHWQKAGSANRVKLMVFFPRMMQPAKAAVKVQGSGAEAWKWKRQSYGLSREPHTSNNTGAPWSSWAGVPGNKVELPYQPGANVYQGQNGAVVPGGMLSNDAGGQSSLAPAAPQTPAPAQETGHRGSKPNQAARLFPAGAGNLFWQLATGNGPCFPPVVSPRSFL